MPAMTWSHRSSIPSVSIRWASIAFGSSRRLRVPRLADHGDLDGARVLQVRLDAPPEFLGDVAGPVVRDLLRGHDDAYLPAGLYGERLLDPADRHRELLQPLEPLDVVLHGLGARAGAGRGDRVREDDDPGVDGLGLHLLVVGCDRVDHDWGLAVALDELGSNARVASLQLAGHGLSDVVKEPGALGQVGIEPDLARDQGGEEGRLDRVVEHVLVVGKPVLELPEELDDLGVEPVDVELVYGVLPGLRGRQVYLVLRALNELLDARRVDASVLDEGLERVAGDLAPHGVERREQDELGRLVDLERHARRRLEGLDVAPFPADQPALHVLAREVDQGRGEVGVGLAGQPLHRGDSIRRAWVWISCSDFSSVSRRNARSSSWHSSCTS